ncbi:MAG TPA: hypothetical protein VFU02_09220 [Polyangiaceae bacterium]|nr:hypothetical protein [Polyangiaceae bacterium]
MFVQRALWLILGLTAWGGCASTQNGAESAHDAMSAKEAQAVLAGFAAQHGVSAPKQPDPTSLPEVVEILISDQTSRFEGALRFLEGKQGGDILTLRALLELSWSDGYTTVSDVLFELNRRSGLEVKRLTERQTTGELTQTEEQMLSRLEERIEAADEVRVACEVLAAEHLEAAAPLASEAVKQGKPGFTQPLTALAFYYLLSGKWLEYDDVMESVRAAERNTLMLTYLNAMESLQRFTLREEAREELRQALTQQPKFVRAQAKLVLLQDDPDAAFAEFNKLKAMSPSHPVLALVGDLIVEEYEASRALSQASGQ